MQFWELGEITGNYVQKVPRTCFNFKQLWNKGLLGGDFLHDTHPTDH